MKIIILLPGRTATMNFTISLLGAINYLLAKGHQVKCINDYSADIYNCRNALLLQSSYVKDGLIRPIKPFNGKEEYDKLLWIDSDMVFTPEDAERIVSHKENVVSGICCVEPGRAALARYSRDDSGKTIGINFFKTDDNDYKALEKQGLFQVDFAGFAFIAVNHGVFESIDAPWFIHSEITIGESPIPTSEDFSICDRITKAGFKIYADPAVRIGHEKLWILRP